ncbi:MAG: ABC transporter ATP-binding protein, partial [Gammaproteobacteria bacterium]|nr:ABC transporter ATP-binding protein [Gammaproteobacteria bacterium]
QEEIWQAITLLKNRRQSILLIDKNIDALTDIADRHYILEKGRIAWLGPSEILKTDADIRQRFLGI